MSETLHARHGGEGTPLLVLLHGLGATGAVWDGLQTVLRSRWPGRWIAPDLPGHGRSAPLPCYSFGHLAAALVHVLPVGEPVVVLGHSLGGVLALTLASGWFGARVLGAAGLGIKVAWSDEELAKARALASRPNPVHATRLEAAERSLRLAGLAGLRMPNDVPDDALARRDGGWEVAFDPAVFGVGAPDLPGLLAAARAPVVLAAGEHDPMCSADQLRELVDDPIVLPGLGHNAHVEAPDAIGPLLDRLAGAAGAARA